MKYIFLVIIFLCFTACTPPDALIGDWTAEQKECLRKEKTILKQPLEGDKQYELSFLSDGNFKLSSFNQEFSVDKLKESGEVDQVRATGCRVDYMGTYSYNFLTGLRLVFSKVESKEKKGEYFYQTEISGKCGLEGQELEVQTLPNKEFFKEDTSVIIKEVSESGLHLNFSGIEICTNDKMTVVFKRKT